MLFIACQCHVSFLHVTMTASDMDLSIEKKIGVTVSEPGSIVLPAKLFTDIIRKLPSEDVEITLGEHNSVSIRTSLSEFRIVGMPADEFPDIGTVSENRKITVDRSVFREMIRETSFAARSIKFSQKAEKVKKTKR